MNDMDVSAILWNQCDTLTVSGKVTSVINKLAAGSGIAQPPLKRGYRDLVIRVCYSLHYV